MVKGIIGCAKDRDELFDRNILVVPLDIDKTLYQGLTEDLSLLEISNKISLDHTDSKVYLVFRLDMDNTEFTFRQSKTDRDIELGIDEDVIIDLYEELAFLKKYNVTPPIELTDTNNYSRLLRTIFFSKMNIRLSESYSYKYLPSSAHDKLADYDSVSWFFIYVLCWLEKLIENEGEKEERP